MDNMKNNLAENPMLNLAIPHVVLPDLPLPPPPGNAGVEYLRYLENFRVTNLNLHNLQARPPTSITEMNLPFRQLLLPWLQNFEQIIPEPRNIMELSARQVSLHIKVFLRFFEIDQHYGGPHIGPDAGGDFLEDRIRLKRNTLFLLNHINRLSVYIQRILAQPSLATRYELNQTIAQTEQIRREYFQRIGDDNLRQIITGPYEYFLGRLNNILSQTQAGGRISIKELMKPRTNVIPGKFSLKI